MTWWKTKVEENIELLKDALKDEVCLPETAENVNEIYDYMLEGIKSGSISLEEAEAYNKEIEKITKEFTNNCDCDYKKK